MKPLDEEQLAALKAAYQEVHGTRMWSEFEKKLRPKPKFAEGQLLIRQDRFNEYTKYFDKLDTKHLRPLNLTELGPDVKALRDAMARLSTGDVGKGGYDSVYCPFAADALNAFDAKHGGE